MSSKGKPKLIECDQGKNFYNSFFQDFLNINNIKSYSRSTFLGAVFADLIVLSEIYFKRSFSNKAMPNGLLSYPQ